LFRAGYHNFTDGKAVDVFFVKLCFLNKNFEVFR